MKCVASLVPDLQVYELVEESMPIVVPLQNLKDYVQYSVYTFRNKPSIVLKHLYLQKH